MRKYPATPEQRGLIAIRGKHGADTLIGHLCSTAGGQIMNYPGQTPFQRENLKKLMRQSHDDLTRLIGRG